MPNPTTVGAGSNYEPAIIEATTAASTVTLNEKKQYELIHNGINTSAAAATDHIMLATDDSTAANTAGAGQGILTTSHKLTLGPNITTLKFDANANAPTFTIIPVKYIPGRY
jgi:hypothetical protein